MYGTAVQSLWKIAFFPRPEVGLMHSDIGGTVGPPWRPLGFFLFYTSFTRWKWLVKLAFQALVKHSSNTHQALIELTSWTLVAAARWTLATCFCQNFVKWNLHQTW